MNTQSLEIAQATLAPVRRLYRNSATKPGAMFFTPEELNAILDTVTEAGHYAAALEDRAAENAAMVNALADAQDDNETFRAALAAALPHLQTAYRLASEAGPKWSAYAGDVAGAQLQARMALTARDRHAAPTDPDLAPVKTWQLEVSP